MAGDPIYRIAQEQIIQASREIEVQLVANNGTFPILVMLRLAKQEAAAALSDLAIAYTANIEDIRKLQNKIHRYDDLVRWLSEIVAAGLEYEDDFRQAERQEVADLLNPKTDEDREELAAAGVDHVHD